MEISIIKKIEKKFINGAKLLFFTPIKIVNFIIKNIFYNKKIDSYLYRIVEESIVEANFYFKVQIINTRAVFDITLTEIFLNYNILYNLDPFQIPRIGYIIKQEEIRKLSSLNKTKHPSQKNKIVYSKIFSLCFIKLKLFLKKLLNKTKITKSFQYIFRDSFVSSGKLQIRLQILTTKLIFDIPVEELLKDFNILKNIDVVDLLKIGYILKEEEANINLTRV